MSKTAYENLDVYKQAVEIAQIVYNAVHSWKNFDRDTVGKQLVRAADSIGANIAEGFGRENGADQCRMLRISRGSMYEVKHFLRLAYTRELLNEDSVQRLKPLLESLPPKLNAYLRAVRRARHSTVHSQPSTI